MKNNKSEMDDVLAIVAASGAGGVKKELLASIKTSLATNNARGFKYMMHYYGLAGAPGLTLEAIGKDVAGGLTRERVRQIIDSALGVLLKAEGAPEAELRPYLETKERFDSLLAASGQQFLRLSNFIDEAHFSGFGVDLKGFIAFLNDASIRQVVYRDAHYIYPKTLDRRDAIELVQVENKKTRRAKTVEKMGKMAKTVTYVPLDAREHLLSESKHREMPLNRLYEKILKQFMAKNPCKISEDFEKTQSWRARKGKAEWSQVGIYIDKDVFDQVKAAAARVKPEPISNMSFICQAFVCFAKGQVKV